MPETLLGRMRRLIQRTPLTRPQIAAGAKVGEDWLKKVESGKIADPGVTRVQRVVDFLDGVKRRK